MTTKSPYFYLRISIYTLLVLCILFVALIKKPQFFNQLGLLPQQAEFWPLIGDSIRKANATEIDKLQLRHWLKEKPQTLFLVDVRTPEEYQLGHIAEAISVPLADFESVRAIELIKKQQKNRQLVTYCASGWRSYKALTILKHHGVVGWNLTGGYETW
jgi:rhodanese-related sulfurtransferase